MPEQYEGWTAAQVGCHWSRGPYTISTIHMADQPEARYVVIRDRVWVGYARTWEEAVVLAGQATEVYTVTIHRTTAYRVRARNEERAVLFALGAMDPEAGESVQETDEATLDHRVEPGEPDEEGGQA